MHMVGQYGRENAAAIFELFMECMPEYPIDKPDQNGNTGTYYFMLPMYFSYDNNEYQNFFISIS